jgi:Mrp family chromosome partitioning ATPase
MTEKLGESALSPLEQVPLLSREMPLFTREQSVRVITFYSYKGGVGRTMALANVAYRLAHRHDLRVIAVDWDLEAPGLPRFFGITALELAQKPGVLDFLIAWRDGVLEKFGLPPDAPGGLIPVVRAPHKPASGSLAILSAGRQDGQYDRRLASFDWREFYRDQSGGIAIERLRRQLLERADVVLVDSRTGLTDPGGICTVQLPDGVVLMAAPNEQSLQGIEGTARAVRDPAAERSGRKPPRVWISLCRVPFLEEQQQTERWLEDHAGWFERGVERGLWERRDHPQGLRSQVLLQRARWGLGEPLLHDGNGLGSSDPLAMGFDALTTTLFNSSPHAQLSGDSEGAIAVSESETSRVTVDALRERASRAEKRGDVEGLADALVELGKELLRAFPPPPEASSVLERAAGIFLARADRTRHGIVQRLLGYVRLWQHDLEGAQGYAEQALSISRDVEDRTSEAGALDLLGMIAHTRPDPVAASEHYRQALAIYEKLGNDQEVARTCMRLAQIASIQMQFSEAGQWLARGIVVATRHDAGDALNLSKAGRSLALHVYESAPAVEQAKLQAMWEAAGLGNLSEPPA